jgi:predicted  nucleic acid-binding Zn ribbon protein
MFTAKVSFPKGSSEPAQVAGAAHDLLSSWYQNGQVVGDTWAFADAAANVEAYVSVPEIEALERVHNNVYANRALDALAERAPRVSILGPDPNLAKSCSCPSRTGLLLFTTYLAHAPPVRCLDCFQPVPLYRLPHLHDQEHLVLLQWAADYRACDTLQMHCTTGERFGEEQLYRHDSALSRNGRDLYSRLEQRTGTPVYYFLHKTRGRSHAAELERRCPSCDSKWLLAKRLHLLLSAIASSVS